MAFVTANAGVKVNIKSQPDAFWTHIQLSTNWFRVAVPDLYTSIVLPDPSNSAVRTVTYGQSSQNIKSSTERITENSQAKLTYTVTAGDILQKYKVNTFQATILYPNDKWVEWNWTYNYLPEDQKNVIDLDADIAEIAAKTLAKLDNYLKKQ
ncbi:hypothetical protein P3X46_028082 [Hevea brasiliensis]|uniref:Bet v I/Major latex protein domain-containing protein n=1 Tax=Hevea brasiliensis TaxID=3981 RepID=A0ABQ9KMV9_HEVBR|nr:uncharacterized protein LOC110649780 [Hevea brasiliensis]KAJ9145736.1 hypothetical protein P3X46_028082 [Hevea brasiliensis]